MSLTFKDFIAEQTPLQTASAETEMASREERLKTARMSDAALKKKKQEELKQLKQSKDPIDREIANLRARIATLMQKKKQQSKQ